MTAQFWHWDSSKLVINTNLIRQIYQGKDGNVWWVACGVDIIQLSVPQYTSLIQFIKDHDK